MHFFVVPDMYSLPSGGNLYNAKLTDALKALEAPVAVIDWETFLDESREGTFWIDTLYMNQWAKKSIRREGQTIGLLVHHLESLYPPEGMDSEQYFETHEKAILEQFDAFLVTSPFTKEYLIRRGCAHCPIWVVPPGTEEHSTGARAAEEGLHAIMVANLIERKGILEWLRLLAAVEDVIESPKMGIDFQLTIIGSGELEPEYAATCHQLLTESEGLKGRVHLAGPRSHAEVMTAYSQSNLFVSTARMETFGMALQEALSSGLPILALNGGHVQAHVQQGLNGYLFHSLDALRDTFLGLARVPIFRQRLLEGAASCRPDPAYDWQAASRLYLSMRLYQKPDF